MAMYRVPYFFKKMFSNECIDNRRTDLFMKIKMHIQRVEQQTTIEEAQALQTLIFRNLRQYNIRKPILVDCVYYAFYIDLEILRLFQESIKPSFREYRKNVEQSTTSKSMKHSETRFHSMNELM